MDLPMIEIKDNETKGFKVNKNEEDAHFLQHDSITVDTSHAIDSEHHDTSESNGTKECEVNIREDDPHLIQDVDTASENDSTSKVNYTSECVSMFFFDVVLPTVDVYTDLSLVVPWYLDGHTKYALAMSIPPLLNLGFTSYKWWSSEKSSEKKWSWLFVILQFYTQWKALQVINLLWKKDPKAHEKKKEMLKEVSSLEPFLESTPSTLIMTMIWFLAINGRNYMVGWGGFGKQLEQYNQGYFHCNTTTYSRERNFCAVFSGFGGEGWFFTSYSISLFASALGITKFLQNGPCAILSKNGMLNWRFIIAYLSVMVSIVTKAIFASILILLSDYYVQQFFGYSEAGTVVVMSLLFFGFNIVPHVLLSILNVALSTGCSKKMATIIFEYPALLILPAFTHFTIGPNNLACCVGSGDRAVKHQLGFSKKIILINMALTVVLYGIVIVILGFAARPDHIALYFGGLFSPILFISILLTILFLALDMECCCLKCTNCFCCWGCCSPNCYETSKDYIDTEMENDTLEVIQVP